MNTPSRLVAGLHAGLFVFVTILTVRSTEPAGSVVRVPVVFSEGHETNPVDHGRPVVLVAGALGVAPEVFREAFSHVHPAGPDSGGPTGDEARQNKRALMSVLGRHGITNDRLDAVSNHYRYVRSHGESWPAKPASAVALVKDGIVTGFEIKEGGSGYSSAPTVTVPNARPFAAEVKLGFNKAFDKNGAVTGITLKAGQ